jgi:hypothetical protein
MDVGTNEFVAALELVVTPEFILALAAVGGAGVFCGGRVVALRRGGLLRLATVLRPLDVLPLLRRFCVPPPPARLLLPRLPPSPPERCFVPRPSGRELTNVLRALAEVIKSCAGVAGGRRFATKANMMMNEKNFERIINFSSSAFHRRKIFN